MEYQLEPLLDLTVRSSLPEPSLDLTTKNPIYTTNVLRFVVTVFQFLSTYFMRVTPIKFLPCTLLLMIKVTVHWKGQNFLTTCIYRNKTFNSYFVTMELPMVTECNGIPDDHNEIPTHDVISHQPHLYDLHISELNQDAQILLLI